jgi:hypothetical protein
MTQTRGRDLHVEGKMLDYDIRGPLTPYISPWFYNWIGRGRSF